MSEPNSSILRNENFITKSNLNNLLAHVRCNQYSLATKDIGTWALHADEALSVIYEIANTVMKEQVLSHNEKRDFVPLLIAYKHKFVHMIKDFRGKDIVKYYNCLHFIVKYIAKEYLAKLLELRELILLDREQVVNNKTTETYYIGTYNLILREVVQSSRLTHRQIIDLVLLQLEMRLIKSSDFAKYIAASFSYFCSININAEMQYMCLVKILSLAYPFACNEDNLSYFAAISNAIQYICLKADKAEKYKIDLPSVILLLKQQNSLAIDKSSNPIIHILEILSLEYVDFAQLHKSLKIETFYKFGIRDVKFIDHIYSFIGAMMQTWMLNQNMASLISEFSTDFMDMFKLIQQHFVLNKKFCQCCSKVDPSNSIRLHTATANLLKHSKTTSPLVEFYEPISHICNENLVQLKGSNCKDFDMHWTKCSSLLYTIGTAMITSTQSGGDKFLLLFLKQIGKFGFSDNFPKGCLYFISQMTHFYFDRNDYKSAALFTAIAIYLDTANFDQIFQRFYHAIYKLNSSLKEHQQIYSISQMLNSNMKTAREYIPTLGNVVDNHRTRELLLLELNYHLTKSQSKSSVVNVIKQLVNYSESDLISAIIQKHYTFFANLDHDLIVLFQNLLKDCKSSSLCSAVLNYLIAKNITNTLIQTNKIDMNNTIAPPKIAHSHFEPAPDPNDTCDIVSTYSSLNLNNHKTILTYLKSALTDTEQCCDRLETVNDLEISFELCAILAHCFRLHCNFTYSESAWILAKTIATKLADNQKILQAIGWLLNKADLNETTKRLLVVGNVIAQEICTQPNSWLRLSWYHLHICNFHLRNCQWESAKEAYQKTKDCMQMMDITLEDKTGFAIHFAFLQSMISRIPCAVAMDKEPHKPELLPKKALKMLISFINNSGYNKVEAYHLNTYFEEIDDVLMRFSLMRLPREIRLHGRDVVALAQKLVLSIRTARVLIHLAKADILSCNMNDCHIKVDGIADILNLCDSYQEDNSQAVIELNVLEAPSMGGSPTFRRRMYNLPFFISHAISCNCFECTTPEYTALILGKMHIDFLLSELQRNSSMSDAIQGMALKVYNFLMTREKASKQIICINYKKVYNETYAYFLLDFALKIGIIRNNIDKVIETNQSIFDLLKDNNRYDSDLLLYEAYVQRTLLLMHQKWLKNSEADDNLNDESEIVIDISNVITPERNITLKPKSKNIVPSELVNIERRTTKNIPFHLSEDEDDNQMKPPNTATVKKLPSPVPKFKVFDDTTKVKSSQKSTRSSKAKQVDLNTAFFCQSSSSSKSKERTKKSTKTLTEKPKRSTAKQQDSCSDSSDVDHLPRPKRNIRKKLLQEL